MHNECQNIYIVQVASLILLDKLTTFTVVLIAQIIAESKLFRVIQLIHFDDCIQYDLTIKELIQFTYANCRSKSS